MKMKFFVLASALLAMETAPLPAQTFTVLHAFTNSPEGATPRAGLLLSCGTLYGTTAEGGSNGVGTVFSMNTDGTNFTTLHSFAGAPDGSDPLDALVLSDGILYGTTSAGGSNSEGGTIFSLNTNGGDYGVLHSFTLSSNGVFPHAGLALSGNTVYGTTVGAGYGSPGWGTVFSMDTTGTNFDSLYSFTTPHGSPLTNPDGEQPLGGVVLQDDTLYGTAYGGGTNGYGTVYSVQTNGTNFTVLHTFMGGPDGQYPQAGVVVSGGMLFGTTESGGTNNRGIVFSLNTDGTQYTVMHNFATNGVDGTTPFADLTLAGDILYGTTQDGGSSGKGTIFSIETNGAGYTVLYNFTNSPGGSSPSAALVFSGNALYGTTSAGGESGWGTVFSLTLPVPTITSVQIVGSNLILDAINGLAGRTYTVLTGVSLALPLNQWTPVASNVLAGSGNFTISATNAVSPVAPQQFYILQMQ